MNVQQRLEWIELMKLYGYTHWQAEVFIAHHLTSPVPVEMPQHSLPDDQCDFDLGGSD